jgi:hypothetical protein
VQPIEPLSPSGVPSIRLCRQLSFGDLLDIFALDERRYRDGVVCDRDFLATTCNVTDALGRDPTPLARQLVPRVNPYIEYLDLKYHVSTKVVVTREQMNVSYVAAKTVSQPSSDAFLLQRLMIPDGTSVLRQRSGD